MVRLCSPCPSVQVDMVSIVEPSSVLIMKKYLFLFFLITLLPVSLLAKEESTNTRSLGLWKYPVNSPAAKMLPDISLIGTFSAGIFSDEPVGPAGHDPARSGFTLQEVEVGFQSVIDNYFRADVFLAIHEDAVELEEGYFTTLSLPKGLQIRGGKFLQPFGKQNQKHLEMWDFADNMLVSKYLLGPENLNELGAEVSYLFPLPFYLNAQFSFSNGENDTSFGGIRNKDFLYLGRLTTSFEPSTNTTVLLGTSAAVGFNSTGPGNKTTIYGGDLLFKWKPRQYRGLTWQTEYLYRKMDIPNSQTDGGFYSYVDYQLVKRWHAGTRFDYVGIPNDLLAKEWRLTPALTFNPTEFSRIRAQYEYDKVQGVHGVHAGVLQFEFSMGPHGAHQF